MWLFIGTQCSLADKRQSRRQKCRFSLLFLGLVKDAGLTWCFFFPLKLQPPSLFPPVLLSTRVYRSDVPYLLSLGRKEAAPVVPYCLCL